MLFNLPFEFYSLKMGKRVCNIGEDTGCAPIEELVCSINRIHSPHVHSEARLAECLDLGLGQTAILGVNVRCADKLKHGLPVIVEGNRLVEAADLVLGSAFLDLRQQHVVEGGEENFTLGIQTGQSNRGWNR